ncbi:MAG TPA: Spy/CpxP family protein refolding chaperone [Gammaproteobacteria bacterium]|nr:Spy/CpxP family protein refolding chaperone [Gammaproteobacteria bacterium]
MTQRKPHHHIRLTLALILCFGVFSAYSVSAEPPGGDGEGLRHTSRDFSPHRLFKLLHRLDISREQRTAIGEVMDKHRPVMREFMFDMMDGKKALQNILTSPDYDPKQIEELAMAQARNAEQMFLATAKTLAEISALLTPEQRLELAELIDERGERGRQRHRERREAM